MNGSYVMAEEGLAHTYQQPTRYIGALRAHSPSKRASSAISKTYKAATTLYLTRRLTEALSTIEPLIVAPKPSSIGSNVGGDTSNTTDDEASSNASSTLPPIATATRSLRVKVWNFYLTLLNAIIELGPEDGKADFGTSVWRGIVGRVRDGSIWEEVVQHGYAGREGSVDADVVANLATLLLGQAPSQLLTQQRLETYLSLSGGSPESALADRLGGLEAGQAGFAEMQRRPSAASGANTPRDLNARAKVLELYTLHVLPRNQEWDTARGFIRASNELDEERKDAFLYTLDTLYEQASDQQDREAELLRQRDEELARRRQEAEAKRIEESRLLDEKSRASISEVASQVSASSRAGSQSTATRDGGGSTHHRSNSEVDYGIEEPKVRKPLRKKEKEAPGSSKPVRHPPQPSSSSGGYGGGAAGGSGVGASSGGGGKGLPRAARPKKARPKSAIQRIPIILAMLQRTVANMTRTMTRDPTTLMRYLLFLFAFLLAFARRDVRQRIGGVLGLGWGKVKATVGMGTKVSYI